MAFTAAAASNGNDPTNELCTQRRRRPRSATLQTLQLPPRERLRATRVVALLMVPEGGNTERGRCFRFWKEAVVQHNGKISFEASEVPVEASRVLP